MRLENIQAMLENIFKSLKLSLDTS